MTNKNVMFSHGAIFLADHYWFCRLQNQILLLILQISLSVVFISPSLEILWSTFFMVTTETTNTLKVLPNHAAHRWHRPPIPWPSARHQYKF